MEKLTKNFLLLLILIIGIILSFLIIPLSYSHKKIVNTFGEGEYVFLDYGIERYENKEVICYLYRDGISCKFKE